MTFAQRRIVVGVVALLVLCGTALGVSAALSADDSGSDTHADGTTSSNPVLAQIDACKAEFRTDLALYVDNAGTVAGTEEQFLRKYGVRSERYRQGIRIVGAVRQEQVLNGTAAAAALLDERVQAFCESEARSTIGSTLTSDRSSQQRQTDNSEGPDVAPVDDDVDPSEAPATTAARVTTTTRHSTSTTSPPTTAVEENADDAYERCLDAYRDYAQQEHLDLEQLCSGVRE